VRTADLLPLGRLLVDAGLGQARQRLVGAPLLVEGLLQQIARIPVFEAVGKRAGRTVRGNLVVLDALGGRDQRRVGDVGRATLGDDLVGLGEDALHALAVAALRLDAEVLEDEVEPLDLDPGFAEVMLERLAEIGRRGGLDHLRHRRDDLTLGVVEVAKLVDVQILERVKRHWHFPSQ